MLYSPGEGEVSLQGATHSLLQPAQRPYLPVPTAGVRRSPLRSPGSYKPEEAALLNSLTEVTAVPCASISEHSSRAAAASLCFVPNLVLVVRALCSSFSRLFAFNSRTQPKVGYHLLALQAPSTRYSCMRR